VKFLKFQENGSNVILISGTCTEAYVHRIKNLSRFSLIALIALIGLMVLTSPMELKAQDDDDMETTVAPIPSGSGAPPVIIDESDSASVPDVEEYDG
jgi:hypothetical protein